MLDLPSSVLFTCTHNAIRSPMAAAIFKHYFGGNVFVDSAGVYLGVPDSFMISVLNEIGIDIKEHSPKKFDHMEDFSFDLFVALSAEARDHATSFCSTSACDVLYWPIDDPSKTEGNREMKMAAYRKARDEIIDHIKAAFINPTT